jgi:integrase
MPSKSKFFPDTGRTLNPTLASRRRKFSLETSTARLRLAVQKKPYRHRLGPGRWVTYRRNEGPGAWSVIGVDGRGKEWLKKIGVADDHEPADGKQILTFAQAVDLALKLTRDSEVENVGQPTTLKSALADYDRDLVARGAGRYNAKWALVHAPASLLVKPITLIDAQEWRRWRDSLSSVLAPASVNRLTRTVLAALNLAAEHNPHITSHPWRIGLRALSDAQRSRNVILSDDDVRALIAAAYALDENLGLFVDVAAVTGSRPSQISRLEVADLRAADLTEAKLLMPRSGKGGGRLRARKKIDRAPVPVTASLARRLKAAAAGRPPDAPLLLMRDGRDWGPVPFSYYRSPFREIVAAIGLDPNVVSLYALRHSSIVRQLLVNTPIRVVASLHDTSVVMIERNYSRFISEHSDQLSRRGLLADAPPADNVVALR